MKPPQLLETHAGARHRFLATFEHLIVDEFQDNSELQSNLLQLMVSGDTPRLTVVGDDDQCIYQFRGAEPGNFRRLRGVFSSLVDLTLVDNYRSTANVVAVAKAFLAGCVRRDEKTLLATRCTGDPVELWKLGDRVSQAKAVAAQVRRRHDEDGVPWGEMACLFRCFKTTEGPMHTQLQEELTRAKVPYCVVGGKSLFERVAVLDLMAYLRLALVSGAEREDGAFARVLNRPPRRLPEKKILPAIERQRQAMGMGGRAASLEAAARQMLSTGVGLKTAQRTQLGRLTKLIDDLRSGCVRADLPQLLQRIWTDSGLDRMHGKGKSEGAASTARARQGKARQAGDSDDEDDSDDKSDGSSGDSDGDSEDDSNGAPDDAGDDESLGGERGAPARQPRPRTQPASANALRPLDPDAGAPSLPVEIQVLIKHALEHVADCKAVQKQTEHRDRARDGSAVPSLFYLCRDSILQNEALLPFPPTDYLPPFVLDPLYASVGRGREVCVAGSNVRLECRSPRAHVLCTA